MYRQTQSVIRCRRPSCGPLLIVRLHYPLVCNRRGCFFRSHEGYTGIRLKFQVESIELRVHIASTIVIGPQKPIVGFTARTRATISSLVRPLSLLASNCRKILFTFSDLLPLVTISSDWEVVGSTAPFCTNLGN